MTTMTSLKTNSFTTRSTLTKALKDNQGTYTINKDGFVTLDLNNSNVQDAIVSEIKKLNKIKIEK